MHRAIHTTVICLIAYAAPLALAETDLKVLAQSPAGTKISYGIDPLQFGELVLPEGDGPHPVAINIHGGCWLAQYNIDHSRALANALAGDGFAVWNLEYRRVGNEGGGWPGTFNDLATGTDYLRELAKTHPLDLSKVLVIGHSAGGHAALWVAARDKIAKTSELYTSDPLEVLGVVGLAPAPQLEDLHKKKVCGHVIDKLMGGSAEKYPKRYSNAAPAHLAPLDVPQILIIGKKDSSWGWVGQAYAKNARTKGDKQIELIEVPDAGHFEVIDPESSAWQHVRNAMQRLLNKG